MNTNNIEKRLFKLQDKEYKEFQSKLIPNINKDNIIGREYPRSSKKESASQFYPYKRFAWCLVFRDGFLKFGRRYAKNKPAPVHS